MKTAQLRRIKEVFLRLQYRPTAEREAAARAECSDDPAVLADVLRLARAQALVNSAVASAGVPETADSDADAAPPRQPAPKPGDVVLGRYELRETLGVGGFGAVYRAFDRVCRETVAVKTVALTNRRLREWHVREAASLRRARAPGVVELLAAGQEGDWAILVMALVDGTPFPGDGVAVGDAAAILPRAVSLLEALGRLHATGVYHRDLKSSNVLVSAGGRATLVDLGIAQDETDAARWLPDGPIVGTLDYMAPERRRGERAGVRSDLYSVGVMLVQALTGEVPEVGRASDDADVRRREELAATLHRITPAPVQNLILSLVAHDPKDRPADASAALDALRSALGPCRAPELPRLGGDGVVRAVAEAARVGKSLDVVGASGSGRTRALLDAERELRASGLIVNWVRRAEDRAQADAAAPRSVLAQDATPEELDRELCDSLRRRVADGLVLFADDFDALDAPTRSLVESLRPYGAVIRVVRAPDGECVRVADLGPGDIEPLIRGPERLFHVPSETAKLLWRRTRGRPCEVVRTLNSWHAAGLVRWNVAVEASPTDVDRLRAMDASPCPAAPPQRLSATARALWNVLTLVGEPLSVAGLADVAGLPRRVVAAELDALIEEELVLPCGSGDRVEAVRGSPLLADVALEERRAWSGRAAAHLPARSEARFRHLVAAGLHDAACRAALDVAAERLDAGNVPAAIAVLDPALAIARRHVHAAADLYAELLAAMADAALVRGTRAAVDLALYHAGLAPERGPRASGWTTVLDAAAAVLDGDARRALALLDAAGDLPCEAHRRAAHVVACHAGRMSRSIEAQRRRVVAAAAWAARGGGERDARALVSAATGWLRYEQGRFDASWRLHARAARLTRRSRARTTSLCNAAMAALEAGDLGAAGELAEEALRAARRGGDSVNGARAELLLRQCAYRAERPSAVDEDLVQAAAFLDRGGTRGMIRLTEAAFAWRTRRLDLAGALAAEAAADLRAGGFTTAALLGAALAAACGGRVDVESIETLSVGPEGPQPAGIAAQAAALAPRPVPAAAAARAIEWARAAPRPDLRREVLSPRETAARLAVVSRDDFRTGN